MFYYIYLFIYLFYSHYQVVVIIIPEGQSVGDLRPPDERYTAQADLDQYIEDFCKEQQTSPKAYIAAEYGRDEVPVPPNNYFKLVMMTRAIQIHLMIRASTPMVLSATV